MSVMFVTGSMSTRSSGPYLSLLQTAQRLKGRGHEITVLGTREKHENGVPAEWQDFNPGAFPKVGPGSLHFGVGVSSWLKTTGPGVDVMSLEGVWLHIGASVARWCVDNGIPYVITAHGNFNPVALAISKWKKQLALRTFAGSLLRNARCYHALNTAEYHAIRDYGIRQPVCVIPNGIDIPNDTDVTVPESIVQQCVGRRTCLYLGRLHPIKGLDRLLRAWSEVRPGSEWQLVLAGGDSDGYLQHLQSIVHDRGLANSVRFVGYVEGDTKAAWLRMADCFVLPSHSEGMPMAALEALSYATPVLLTDACNLHEAATAGGAMVVPSTEAGIRDGVAEMTLRHSSQLKEMGVRGCHFVRSNYDWNHVCQQLEAVYTWMLGLSPVPDFVCLE